MRVQHSVLQIDQVVVDHIGECVEGFLFERPPIWMLDIACDDPSACKCMNLCLAELKRTIEPLCLSSNMESIVSMLSSVT